MDQARVVPDVCVSEDDTLRHPLPPPPLDPEVGRRVDEQSGPAVALQDDRGRRPLQDGSLPGLDVVRVGGSGLGEPAVLSGAEDGQTPHVPVKFGGRFSKNADMASIKSLVLMKAAFQRAT